MVHVKWYKISTTSSLIYKRNSLLYNHSNKEFLGNSQEYHRYNGI